MTNDLNHLLLGPALFLAFLLPVLFAMAITNARLKWPTLIWCTTFKMYSRHIRPDKKFSLPVLPYDVEYFEIGNFTTHTYFLRGEWEPKEGDAFTDPAIRPTTPDGALIIAPFRSYRMTKVNGTFTRTI